MVRRAFGQIRADCFGRVVARFAPDAVFVFAGEHALGAELHGPAAISGWFERAFRLFPDLRLEPQTVIASGPPWNTVAATRFTLEASLPGSRPYRNEGMQFLRLRWGRVVEDRLYEDTQRLVEALAYLAERGNGEAGAPPLSAAGVPDDTGARRAEQPGSEKKNPFTSSATGGRVLSALQLPLFAVRPPRGYGILTTRGRKTGKTRRRCIRAVRRGDRAYIVAIKGARTAWLRNAQANPRIRLRVRGATLDGIARDPRGESESREAMEAYCHEVGWFAHLEYAMWRSDRPTSAKIRELHRSWFQRGHPLVVELESGHDAAR